MEAENGAIGSVPVVYSQEDMNGDDEDWLESDGEEGSKNEMDSRDSKKVQGKLYDEGYRSGITKGKEVTVQLGFDFAYNTKGAPLGRKYGYLLGSITALSQYTIKMGKKDDEKEIAKLLADVKVLQVSDLAEPDWEAIEHEREHGNDISHIKRETAQDKKLREQKLDSLLAKVDRLVEKVPERQCELISFKA